MELPNKKTRRDGVHVADSISCGTIRLPAGVEAAIGIMTMVFMYLDVKSLLKVLESSLLKQLCVAFKSRDFLSVRQEALAFNYAGHRRILEMIHNPKQLYLLYKRYKKKFETELKTPFVYACGQGRVEDVNQFINLHKFHAYIDIGPSNKMDVTAMVNEPDRHGLTPLLAVTKSPWPFVLDINAVQQRSTIIEILLQYNADTGATDMRWNGQRQNALHNLLKYTKTTTDVQLLLNHMKLEDINRFNRFCCTPLDNCYIFLKNSPIQQQLIDLIRQKGGKTCPEIHGKPFDIGLFNNA